MSEERVTVWITKWALTQGIIEAKECIIKEGFATRSNFGRSDYVFAKVGKDAFLDLRDAKLRVSDLINARLRALAKEQKKLKTLFATLESDTPCGSCGSTFPHLHGGEE